MTTSKRAFLLLAAGLVPPLVLAAGRAQAADEPPVQGEGRTLAYLNDLHTKVHRAWADSFLAMAAARLPKDHPVNLATRAVVVELASPGRPLARYRGDHPFRVLRVRHVSAGRGPR